MKTIDLHVHAKSGERTVRFQINQLLVAGWTGRKQSDVEEHIKELEAIGIPAPKETPLYYRLSHELVTTGDRIEVAGPDTSGEAESVLFFADGETFVGVGSDHTDRKLEALSVTQSKQICAKPVSADVWPFSEVLDHWDQLVLESRTGDDPAALYQSGPTAALRSPQELLDIFRTRGGVIGSGTIMFCGTLPVIGKIQYAENMQLKLIDPILGREIRHSYATVALPIVG